MNLETVLTCAKMAAAVQQSGLGYVSQEIQDLINELAPPVVEEPVEVAQAEAEAEAMEAAEVEQVPPAPVEQVPEQPAEA